MFDQIDPVPCVSCIEKLLFKIFQRKKNILTNNKIINLFNENKTETENKN